jgi:hypothetical protein
MLRPLALTTTCLAAVLAIAPMAHAATPSCNRGGAKVLAAEGSVSIVSVTPKQKGNTVPKDKVYGCWISNGKRFQLFSWYPDSEEETTFDIVGGRYIGVFRIIEEGVAGNSFANTWDARKRVALHGTAPCNGTQEDPSDDESRFGPESAVFFNGGGIAYTCAGGTISHIVDAKGDRTLEPDGTQVAALAVTPSGNRLYYFAGDAVKTLEVGM